MTIGIVNLTDDNTIYSSRVINAPLSKVYIAFSNKEHLKNWWGPEGFTNTIHEFDLRPGGNWTLTMHGPEKGNYENASIFEIVEPYKRIRWKRISQPLFKMEVGFKEIDSFQTEISFLMIFDTAKDCQKIRLYAIPKNEENFDRLEREIKTIIDQ